MKKKDWFLKVSMETYPEYASLPEAEWVECLQYRDKVARRTTLTIIANNALLTRDTQYDGGNLYPVVTQGLQLLAYTNIFCARNRFAAPMGSLFNSLAHTSITVASLFHILAEDTLDQYTIFGLSVPEEDERLSFDFCMTADYLLKDIPQEFITKAETREWYDTIQNRVTHFLESHLRA